MAGIQAPETAMAYERSLRKIARTPMSMAAVPDTTGVTLAYAAAAGREEARARAAAADVNYSEKRLALDEKIFQGRMDYNRKLMDIWAEQNKWATAIAAANLGIEGLMAPVKMREAERQAIDLHDIAEGLRRNAATLTEGTAKNVADTEPALRAIADKLPVEQDPNYPAGAIFQQRRRLGTGSAYM